MLYSYIYFDGKNTLSVDLSGKEPEVKATFLESMTKKNAKWGRLHDTLNGHIIGEYKEPD